MRLCIVGSGRCGTTLLWRMLDSHPDLFVFRETHWLPTLYEVFGTAPGPTAAMLDIVERTNFVTGDRTTKFDAETFLASPDIRPEMTVPEFGDALGMFFARNAGKKYWADKTPDYGYFSSTLQVYWPECRILHLIRDGVSCAISMSRHIGYQALADMGKVHWPPLAVDYRATETKCSDRPLEYYADLWAMRLARARNEARRLTAGSYRELRYEDLVASPRAALENIVELAGLSCHAGWLESSSKLVDAKTAAPRPRPAGLTSSFSPYALRLMQELGYGDQPIENPA